MFRTTSKDGVFFDQFSITMEEIYNAAKLLEDLMTDFTDVPAKIEKIEEIEHHCDNHVHTVLEQLNKSFITPIDREDIHLVAKEMDNIVDAIEATAHRFKMFNVKAIKEEAINLARLITKSTVELKELFGDLKKLKSSKLLKEKIIEVNRLENVGDGIFRSAIESLFLTEKDALEVIKWKEIYEYLENSLDACEDVANAIEGVVMKNA